MKDKKIIESVKPAIVNGFKFYPPHHILFMLHEARKDQDIISRQYEVERILKIIDKWIDSSENGDVKLDYTTLSFIRNDIEDFERNAIVEFGKRNRKRKERKVTKVEEEKTETKEELGQEEPE